MRCYVQNIILYINLWIPCLPILANASGSHIIICIHYCVVSISPTGKQMLIKFLEMTETNAHSINIHKQTLFTIKYQRRIQWISPTMFFLSSIFWLGSPGLFFSVWNACNSRCWHTISYSLKSKRFLLVIFVVVVLLLHLRANVLH